MGASSETGLPRDMGKEETQHLGTMAGFYFCSESPRFPGAIAPAVGPRCGDSGPAAFGPSADGSRARSHLLHPAGAQPSISRKYTNKKPIRQINNCVVCTSSTFQPDEPITEDDHRGFLTARSRGRRAEGGDRERREEVVLSGQSELPPEAEYTYNLNKEGGVPCILAQTECDFELEYWTMRWGKQTASVKLPKDPQIRYGFD